MAKPIDEFNPIDANWILEYYGVDEDEDSKVEVEKLNPVVVNSFQNIQALAADLLQVVNQHPKNKLNKEDLISKISSRLSSTVEAMLSSVLDEKISKDQQEQIANTINQATAKLAEEVERENKPSILWKYQNSLNKAARMRHMVDFIGIVYDVVSSMYHNIAKIVGISSPTAADLFEDAAKMINGISKPKISEVLQSFITKKKIIPEIEMTVFNGGSKGR